MKKIILIVALLALSVSVWANSIHYFTYSQAQRTISYLDAQQEIMIYCGYDDEIETYVLLNEVWAERINSQYYEIWVYGWDAYTGDEIYMPIDLGCIWLFNRTGTRMYNAATTLRFRHSHRTPTFLWAMPPYNPYVRHPHAPGFLYTYHYDIHQPGWRHPGPNHNPYNYHPYYMRRHSDPAPVHHQPWTPGVDHPQTMTPDGHGYLGNVRGNKPTTTVGNPTGRATSSSASTRRTTGNTATPNTIVTPRATSSANTGNTSRGTSTSTSSNTRSGSTATSSSSNTRSGSTATSSSSNTRSGSTATSSSSNTRSGISTTSSSSNTRSGSTATSSSSNTRSGSSTTSSSSNTRSGSSTTSSSPNTRSGSSTSTSSSSNTRSGSTSTNGSSSTRSTSSSTNTRR